MGDESQPDVVQETIVTTTEPGVVLTGTHAEAFEARVMRTVRKPVYVLSGLLFVLFVILMGLSFVVSRISDTVSNTDSIVTTVAGPKARVEQQAQQAQVLKGLLAQMNCQDQRNLQKFVDELAKAGAPQLANIDSLVDENCK